MEAAAFAHNHKLSPVSCVLRWLLFSDRCAVTTEDAESRAAIVACTATTKDASFVE